MIQRDVVVTSADQRADFHVMGAGWFRATEITKRGGASDNTEVIVELDGEQVFASSFASLKKPWMQLNTPFIVAKVRDRRRHQHDDDLVCAGTEVQSDARRAGGGAEEGVQRHAHARGDEQARPARRSPPDRLATAAASLPAFK